MSKKIDANKILKTNPLPSQEYLKECFSYDEENGVLVWRTRSPVHFDHAIRNSVDSAKAFNNKFANKKAGSDKGNGYLMTTINGRRFLVHRLIWKLKTGEDPKYIDHINGIRSDNRIDNLRDVDAMSNSKNCFLSVNNSSSQNGVHWSIRKDRWCATIGLNFGSIYLGSFISFQEAKAARKAAEKVLSYSERHGEKLECVHD
jgi:hypothetical protein